MSLGSDSPYTLYNSSPIFGILIRLLKNIKIKRFLITGLFIFFNTNPLLRRSFSIASTVGSIVSLNCILQTTKKILHIIAINENIKGFNPFGLLFVDLDSSLSSDSG